MERKPEQQTEQKKKKKGVRAWFKKRWRAMKHTFSCTQSNEVVPFHTQSDQDPSDPQPGPSEQPYLRVFKPVVLADTADRPGCYWEQTPLEDPVDPQQDPSGLKQTAPEEPADHRPAPSNQQQTEGKKKKKGVRARFKKGWAAMKRSCSRNNKVVPLPTQSDLDPVDPQPAPEDPQPAPEDPQPAPEDPQPAPEDPQPAPEDPQPAPEDPQPAPEDPQPAPEDPQPAPEDPQPAPEDPQPAPEDPQPAPEDPQPAPEDPQPAPEDPQPAPEDPQPAPEDPQPAPEDPQPAPEDPQPAPEDPAEHRPEQQTEGKKKKKGVRAWFKKRWRAMKHTFSCTQSNEVVPFHTQSDQDPSDPQPGPSEQPYLRVFKPAVLADTADRPGCYWEQTPLEDPVDPQQDPSGLKQTAPEEPAASQPGSSNLSPYALRILSYFPPPRFFTYPAPWMYQQQFLDELDEYKAFSSLYEVGTKNLGKGHRGIVYEGTRRSDGLKVAIKFMHKLPRFDEYIHIPGHDKPLFSEVALNLLLQKPEKCPNIVDLLDWFEEEYTHILVLEYPYPCFTVKDFLRVEHLSENQARDLMRQAVNAAKHCIDHNVCHGGLEVRNVLINVQTMTLKFIDFGCGHFASTWGKPGTKIYGRAHAVADTVYGLGKLLLYLTRGDWVIQFYNHVKLDDPKIKDLGLTEECLDLINRCKFAPLADRPTLEELLDHEWFKQG